jgi:hypothetical protein
VHISVVMSFGLFNDAFLAAKVCMSVICGAAKRPSLSYRGSFLLSLVSSF